MSDEDVSAEDTRYIWAGYVGRLAGELLFAGVREARDLWPHPIDLRYFADRVYIVRLKTGACQLQVQ